MKATVQNRIRLEKELQRLVEQLKAMGAVRIMLFGSLAREEISLFSDIDLLVLFEEDRPSRELTRRIYQQIDARESVDILVYSQKILERLRDRPFLRLILEEGKLLRRAIQMPWTTSFPPSFTATKMPRRRSAWPKWSLPLSVIG